MEKGFTLTELLVAITIMAILSSVGIASFVSYSRTQELNSATQDVVTMLQLAKASANSQIKPSSCTPGSLKAYKVFTSSSDNNFFSEPVCDDDPNPNCDTIGDTASKKTQELSANISFSSNNCILFRTITGDVSFTSSSIVLRHSQLASTKTITITVDGRIHVQ